MALSVAEALRAKKYEEALEALLQIWRTTHDPQIGGVIAQVSSQVGGETEEELDEDADVSAEEFHQTWMAIARKSTSADVVPLLDTLTSHAKDLTQIVERYECIIDRAADDPRLARGLADVVDRRFEQGNVGPADELAFYERVIQKIASMRDEAAQQRLFHLGYHAHPWSPIAAAGASAAESILRARPPTKVDPRFFETIHADIPIRKPDRNAGRPPADPIERRAWTLLQRIYDDPDDDEARLVYADALSEMNDPRGEAIVLGFKVAEGKARVTDRRRLKELVDRHGGDWLGIVKRIVDVNRDIEFEKGFPILLRTRWHTRWSEVVEARELSTVRILETTGSYSDFRATLSSPIFRHVRALRISASERLDPPLPIFERIIDVEVHTSMLIPEDLANIKKAFPNVTTFAIHWTDDRAWDTRAMRPSDPATFIKLVSDPSPTITSLTFRMRDRTSGFLTNVFESLPHAKKTLEKLAVSAGPEGFILTRPPSSTGASTGWHLTVESRDESFDPARVRLLFQALPESLPITNRTTVEIPAPTTSPKKKKK